MSAFDSIIRQVLERDAAEGKTLRQAAEWYGIPYKILCSKVRCLGIQFVLEKRGRKRVVAREELEFGAAAGLTLPQLAKRLGLRYQVVWTAAKRENITFPKSWRGRPFKRTPAPQIEVHQSVRETAIANRGHASASQIGAALGVSRNVIIGHWQLSKATSDMEREG